MKAHVPAAHATPPPCANCGKPHPRETETVWRPATAKEIEAAYVLRERANALYEEGATHAADRLRHRAFRMAQPPDSGWVHGRVVDAEGRTIPKFAPDVTYHATRELTGEYRLWYGRNQFCTLKCCEAFAVKALDAGYRVRGPKGVAR